MRMRPGLRPFLTREAGCHRTSQGRKTATRRLRKLPPLHLQRAFAGFTSDISEDSCKFIRSTVRGGTRVEYDGSIVVIGDVNPGREIVASGNVIVLGTLRGMVHAGAGGNRDAFIYALSLKANPDSDC